jgi:hypothetical protein
MSTAAYREGVGAEGMVCEKGSQRTPIGLQGMEDVWPRLKTKEEFAGPGR